MTHALMQTFKEFCTVLCFYFLGESSSFLHISSSDTAATLRHLKELPTGIHKVPIEVTDLQGSGKPQTAIVRICHCRNGACPTKEISASLGGLGILAMLLPLLLLLLLGESLTAILCPDNETGILYSCMGKSARWKVRGSVAELCIVYWAQSIDMW